MMLMLCRCRFARYAMLHKALLFILCYAHTRCLLPMPRCCYDAIRLPAIRRYCLAYARRFAIYARLPLPSQCRMLFRRRYMMSDMIRCQCRARAFMLFSAASAFAASAAMMTPYATLADAFATPFAAAAMLYLHSARCCRRCRYAIRRTRLRDAPYIMAACRYGCRCFAIDALMSITPRRPPCLRFRRA